MSQQRSVRRRRTGRHGAFAVVAVLATVRLASAAAATAPRARLPEDSLLAVRAEAMVDVRRGTLLRHPLIVVRNGRITSVGPDRGRVPAGARLIDLPGLILLPGLIDAHVHLTIGGQPAENARATLRAGFTTVQDLGALRGASLRLRDAIAGGQTDGPRMLVAGPWIGAAHGVCDFDSTQVSSDTAIARRVRAAVAAGADVIKLCVTGWPADSARPPELSREEVQAGVREAHAGRRRVMAHAIGRAGARLAIDEGVDALCHAAFLAAADVEAMRGRGMPMITTLLSFERAGDPASLALVERARWAIGHGVRIVFGTDAGVIAHGTNAGEFGALRRAGVTPEAAIRAATVDAARLLGIADSVGMLSPGFVADIVAVPGNPLEDLEQLNRVQFVMQGGRVVVSPPSMGHQGGRP